MDILKENKLITKFMKGYDFEHLDGGLPLGDFHTSWDWLMPVVTTIKDMLCVIEKNKWEGYIDKMDQGLMWGEIDDVYKAVVEFIKQEYENYLEEKADSDISIMKDEGLM